MFDLEIQARPFLSIIIATRNEERYIGRLLDSIVNQTYPKIDFEVLIIDGMSKDSTTNIVNEYKNRLNLRVLINPKTKAVFGFNIGIDEAKGDFFILIGGHSFLSEKFIEDSVNTFFRLRKEEPMLAGVGGICIDEFENKGGKIVALLYSSLFSGARSCRYKKISHFSDSVIFGLFDKKIVIENGKFDEDFLAAGEDDELTIRLRNRGYKFFTNSNIISHYFNRNSFLKFIKQTFNYGVAKGIMVRKGNYKPEFSNSASLWFIPASFLIYELLVSFLLIFFGLSFAYLLIPFMVYWIVSIVISLRLLKNTKSRLCFFLPFIYFVFHNVLGISSISGLLFGKKAFL
jgi:dolichyl N-acetyl-alpha-D-glucosaminyl phosphate 3-beta-D-2,3-diacetamido-2,3-dideoxy-beta-D-glucuronosyltransferase